MKRVIITAAVIAAAMVSTPYAATLDQLQIDAWQGIRAEDGGPVPTLAYVEQFVTADGDSCGTYEPVSTAEADINSVLAEVPGALFDYYTAHGGRVSFEAYEDQQYSRVVSNARYLDGYIMSDYVHIVIRTGLRSASCVSETLIHELMHAVYHSNLAGGFAAEAEELRRYCDDIGYTALIMGGYPADQVTDEIVVRAYAEHYAYPGLVVTDQRLADLRRALVAAVDRTLAAWADGRGV